MARAELLIHGFSLIRAGIGTAGTAHSPALIFDARSVILLDIDNTSQTEPITHSAYVAGLQVFHSARACLERRPLFRYAAATRWHAAPVRNLVTDRGLARFEFEAAGFRTPDPGAPRLGRVEIAVGQDLRARPRPDKVIGAPGLLSHAG